MYGNALSEASRIATTSYRRGHEKFPELFYIHPNSESFGNVTGRNNVTPGCRLTEPTRRMGDEFSKNALDYYLALYSAITQDSLSSILALFWTTLPDSQQDLFAQVNPSLNPSSFERFFLELPLELRLYISRFKFPGRRTVSIDQECFDPNYSTTSGSQQTTILSQSHYPSIKKAGTRHCDTTESSFAAATSALSPKKNPPCFNPTTDSAYITPFSFSPSQVPFARWMENLALQFPHVLDAITELEIRTMPWDRAVRAYLKSREMQRRSLDGRHTIFSRHEKVLLCRNPTIFDKGGL